MLEQSQIHKQLAQYINGDLSYREFEIWLVDQMYEDYFGSPQAERDLVGDIRLAMYEYSVGHTTESELKDELRQFLEVASGDAAIQEPTIGAYRGCFYISQGSQGSHICHLPAPPSIPTAGVTASDTTKAVRLLLLQILDTQSRESAPLPYYRLLQQTHTLQAI
jgi:hypothetical protein